jgi:hypothetical protein
VDYLKTISDKQKNITLFLSPENLGCVNGRNYAYSLSADTDYVCFIDDDQFVSNGWVESYLSHIERGYDIVGFEGWRMRDDFFPNKKVLKNEDYNYVGCGGMFLKRKVIDDIGLFDPQFNPLYFEDPDFCWKADKAGYKICWNEEEKIFHKPHRLLNPERRVYFNKSWHLFQKKWKNHKMPIFKNTIAK